MRSGMQLLEVGGPAEAVGYYKTAPAIRPGMALAVPKSRASSPRRKPGPPRRHGPGGIPGRRRSAASPARRPAASAARSVRAGRRDRQDMAGVGPAACDDELILNRAYSEAFQDL